MRRRNDWTESYTVWLAFALVIALVWYYGDWRWASAVALLMLFSFGAGQYYGHRR